MNTQTTEPAPGTPGPDLVLLQGAEASDAGTACWMCRTEPVFPGHYFIAANLGPTHAGFLCTTCTRATAPTLAAAVEALNLLRALADDIDPRHAPQLARAALDIAEQLS